MPIANVRGANINYEVIGDFGSWVALSPGGRRDMSGVRELAQRIAAEDFRVLLHDRRNCGASDVVLEGEDAEYEIWADDLAALLSHVGARKAFVGGASAGCRLSLLVYLRHPEIVSGLLLWRVTGGEFAAKRLAETYYGQFIEAARKGGMQAVCETEHFSERIAANPANRERILAMDPQKFIESFSRWQQGFLKDAELPVIGASQADLNGVGVPTIVVPGNDRTHPRAVGVQAARMIPNAELCVLLKTDRSDMDVSPPEEMEAILDEQTRMFVDFMQRNEPLMA